MKEKIILWGAGIKTKEIIKWYCFVKDVVTIIGMEDSQWNH